MHDQPKRRLVIVRLIRLLAGVLVTAGCFQWHSTLASQTWLFPFLFLMVTSMLTAWVTGPPWGWVVTAGWIVLGGGLAIARAIQGPLTWFYHRDLVAAVLGQGETLMLTGLFAMFASAAGLCAWGSTALLRHLFQRGRDWYVRPPG